MRISGWAPARRIDATVALEVDHSAAVTGRQSRLRSQLACILNKIEISRDVPGKPMMFIRITYGLARGATSNRAETRQLCLGGQSSVNRG